MPRVNISLRQGPRGRLPHDAHGRASLSAPLLSTELAGALLTEGLGQENMGREML